MAEPVPLLEFSNEMVRLYKELFGRGPTTVRTDFAGPDVVITTLKDSLTSAERRMAELGDHQKLRDLRTYFQYVSEDKFCEAAERLTGRRVVGFVSGIDTKRDISSEVFYLEPSGSS